jgi:GT2 family glycosyltransferase
MKQYPRVTIVTPVFNGIEHTRVYLESLSGCNYPNYEVVIVDDGSSDGSAAMIAARYPQVRILHGDGNLWWSGGTNRGIQDALARGTDFILTMNNDVTVAPDFLSALVDAAAENPGAIVGGKIYFMDEPQRIWSAGGRLSWITGKTLIQIGHGEVDRTEFCRRERMDFLTGMNVLIPAGVFARIGFYDEIHFPQYHADSEFTLRARKSGIPIIFEPSAKVWNQVESTFMQRFLKSRTLNLTAVRELLTSIRSPMRLSCYWLLHKRYCNPLLLPWAFSLRMARVAVFLLKIKLAMLRGGKSLEEIGV